MKRYDYFYDSRCEKYLVIDRVRGTGKSSGSSRERAMAECRDSDDAQVIVDLLNGEVTSVSRAPSR